MIARRVLLALSVGVLFLSRAQAQTPAVQYTWPTGISDWFHNFGTGTGVLSNSGSGDLLITENSATAGTGAAWSDGFNTIRDTPSPKYSSGQYGGADYTGLASLQFDMGHNGSGPI